MISYARFVQNRQALWSAFEQALATLRTTPRRLGFAQLETLALQYRHILHDHGIASSRFAGTAAARHLAHLSVEGTRLLHTDEATGPGGVAAFFFRTFPAAFRRRLPELGVSLALFVVSLVLGLFLAVVQPAVGTALLGPAAAEGLREGRLWTDALLTAVPPTWSSSAIATNNMGVAITAFAGGLLAGLGAFYVVILNGFMLGAIVGTTWHYGLAHRLVEFVSAHGPLEITLILCASAAGLGVGRAFVEATDRPRREVLGETGRDAAYLVLGCLPWFLLLGLVEAFLSPSPSLTPLMKLATGVLLLALFLSQALHKESS